MSDDKGLLAKEAAVAMFKQAYPPVVVSLRFIGSVLDRPDLAADASNALLDDAVQLNEDIQHRISRLDSALRAKIDANDLAELVVQSFVNMGRTASAEKRQMIRNVVVHGIDPSTSRAVESRLFLQAISDLDVAQIALLRQGNANEGELVDPPEGDLALALIQPLVTRGFLQAFQSSLSSSFDAPDELPISTTYRLTALGARFLEFALAEVDV